MKGKPLLVLFSLSVLISGCAFMQSAVKSTFPYTAILVIPQSSQVGVELAAMADISSFDQDISKNGNPGDKVKDVRVVSAKLQSKDPTDFNIGNFDLVKVYLSGGNGSNEVLAAWRTDITAGVGNSMVLDIEDSASLDKIIASPKVKVRLVYKLHNHINVTANLHLSIGLSANPK